MNYFYLSKNVISTHFLLFLSLLMECSCDLKFADWAKPCKMADPTGAEILEPKFECDVGRGLTCQNYQQGKLCGCSGALSYDRRSEECRRKVATACHIPKAPEEYARQAFNHKCHADAECVIYSGTLIGGKIDAERKKTQNLQPICLCKHGFTASSDLSECRDPNGMSALQPSILFLLLTLGSLLYFRS